ncbi:MAG: thioredoxin family protein [Bacteroidia bacterium]
MVNYKEKFQKGMTYAQYLAFTEEKVANNSSSGVKPSVEFINYTKLNLSRMKRAEKTIKINAKLADKLQNAKLNIIALTETWCGDASQNTPILGLLEREFSGVKVSMLLRDEHHDIMNRHLTNGGMAIPKFIFLDGHFNIIGEWGPRPKPLQKMVLDNKNSKHPIPHDEFSIEIQKWYNQDKSETLQSEITALLES